MQHTNLVVADAKGRPTNFARKALVSGPAYARSLRVVKVDVQEEAVEIDVDMPRRAMRDEGAVAPVFAVALALALALVAFAGTALADHQDAHNLTSNVNASVNGFVPLIVTLFLVGIALAALTGFWVGKRR